ncbi:MAG: EamA family transporter, partial [Candidatus Aminicenantes bacterium]|nr:EamA family transporter [Candidatus Aminicenantes bacterium]
MYIGEIAAVLTALCWSVNSILFSDAGRKIGSQSVNHLRLWGALLLLILIQIIAFNRLIPDISSSGLLFLAVSGVIGFFIGDALLFEAYVLIGARMGMLMMTTVPVFSVGLAWVFLSEKLGLWQLAAIGLTTLSIALVVAEKRNGKPQNQNLSRGILFGLGGAMGQAIGLLFSKRGMLEGVHPISANLIRVLAATVVMTVYFLIKKRFFSDFLKLKQDGIFPRIVGGAILGPVIGVILSLVAILYAPMGIASTL